MMDGPPAVHFTRSDAAAQHAIGVCSGRIEGGPVRWVKPTECQGLAPVGCTHPNLRRTPSCPPVVETRAADNGCVVDRRTEPAPTVDPCRRGLRPPTVLLRAAARPPARRGPAG